MVGARICFFVCVRMSRLKPVPIILLWTTLLNHSDEKANESSSLSWWCWPRQPPLKLDHLGTAIKQVFFFDSFVSTIKTYFILNIFTSSSPKRARRVLEQSPVGRVLVQAQRGLDGLEQSPLNSCRNLLIKLLQL